MKKQNNKINIDREATSTEHYFYLNNGITLKSIAELINQLDTMDQKIFNFHVHKKNNDFANWVRDVFGEKQLAKRMALTRSPGSMVKAITKFLKT